MKNVIIILFAIFSVVSCNNDDDASNKDNSPYVGTWKWTNTDGGIGNHIHDTPESTGQYFFLTLNRDYSFTLDGLNERLATGTYQLLEKESYVYNQPKIFINLSYTDVVPEINNFSGIIEIDGSHLYINNDFPDGVEHKFEIFEPDLNQ